MPRPAGLTQQPTKQKKVNYLIRHYIQNGNQVNNQYLSTQELSILLRINQNQTLKLIRQQTIKLARLYAISQPSPKKSVCLKLPHGILTATGVVSARTYGNRGDKSLVKADKSYCRFIYHNIRPLSTLIRVFRYGRQNAQNNPL